MDENEFVIDGKIFVSKECDGHCGGCYFDYGLDCLAGEEAPNCSRETRKDGRFVIFVEKQQ